MSNDAIWNKLTELSMVCAMNARYYQEMQSRSYTAAVLLELVFLPLATLCFLVVFAELFKPYDKIRQRIALSIACLSIGASATAERFAVAWTRDAGEARCLFRSWNSLQYDVDLAVIDLDGSVGKCQPSALHRYERMLSRSEALHSRDQHRPDVDLLEKCLADEERSRGVEPKKKDESSKWPSPFRNEQDPADWNRPDRSLGGT